MIYFGLAIEICNRGIIIETVLFSPATTHSHPSMWPPSECIPWSQTLLMWTFSLSPRLPPELLMLQTIERWLDLYMYIKLRMTWPFPLPTWCNNNYVEWGTCKIKDDSIPETVNLYLLLLLTFWLFPWEEIEQWKGRNLRLASTTGE